MFSIAVVQCSLVLSSSFLTRPFILVVGGSGLTFGGGESFILTFPGLHSDLDVDLR